MNERTTTKEWLDFIISQLNLGSMISLPDYRREPFIKNGSIFKYCHALMIAQLMLMHAFAFINF